MKTKLLLIAVILFVQRVLFAQTPPLKPLPQADWNKNGKDNLNGYRAVSN